MGKRTEEMAFDTIIRGGTVVTAADIFSADVGIEAGRITALGVDLGDCRMRHRNGRRLARLASGRQAARRYERSACPPRRVAQALYRRFSEQIETASAEEILSKWR